MASVEVDIPTSKLGGDTQEVALKEARVQVKAVAVADLTPATTPEQQSPNDEDTSAMTGKKIFDAQKSSERARELVKELTLREQVRGKQRLLRLQSWLLEIAHKFEYFVARVIRTFILTSPDLAPSRRGFLENDAHSP